MQIPVRYIVKNWGLVVQDFYMEMNICYIQVLTKQVHILLIKLITAR